MNTSTSRRGSNEPVRNTVIDPEGLSKVLQYHVERGLGVLSDIEIIQLCTLPERYTDRAAVEQGMRVFEVTNPDLNTFPMRASAVTKIAEERDRLMQLHTHEVTPEIRAAFVPMIENFVEKQVKEEGEAKKISYGVSSFGYDVRLSDEIIDGKQPFVIFTNHRSALIDPKRADEKRNTTELEVLTDEDGSKYVIMPAHTYGMGFTMERFNIPRDVTVICVGKSTYARSSVYVNVTPIEAGFKGSVVIELGNSTGSPVKIYLNEGIAQFIFLRGNRECATSYGDRSGKYQGQRGITHAKV